MNEFLFFQDAKKELKPIEFQEKESPKKTPGRKMLQKQQTFSDPINANYTGFLDDTKNSPKRFMSDMNVLDTSKSRTKRYSVFSTSSALVLDNNNLSRNLSTIESLADSQPKTLMSQKLTEMSELNPENMEQKFNEMSLNYVEQYIRAGFPPKICAQLVGSLCNENRDKKQILNVGCGKGEVGQALRDLGFINITGIDSCKGLLEQAESTKCYIGTDRIKFAEENNPVPIQYIGKQDFVVCHSLINNMLEHMGLSSTVVFQQIHDCLKNDGYAVFATKTDMYGNNVYEKEIKKLEDEGYWKFITDYKFYRYDKVCGDQIGKFSPRKIHYLVYQKLDHVKWLTQQENVRLAEVAEKERLAYVTEMMRMKQLAQKRQKKGKEGRRGGIRWTMSDLQ